MVDAPEWLVRPELSYDNGAFFARLDANRTGEGFYTCLNDASAKSQALLSIGANVSTICTPGALMGRD